MMIDTSNTITLTQNPSFDWESASEQDMDFTLTYEGPLYTKPSAANKNEIRRYFHPQLKELWKQRLYHRVNPNAEVSLETMPLNPKIAWESVVTIADQYRVCTDTGGTAGIVPLVTKSLVLACRLDIFVLGKGVHQRIFDNADLDNRLKGLVDGLRRPDKPIEIPGWTPTPDEDPLYCLLENDSLVTDLRISGDTLLDPSIVSPDEYHLFIRVKVRPLRYTLRNADFA
jgi:hypothetical protein